MTAASQAVPPAATAGAVPAAVRRTAAVRTFARLAARLADVLGGARARWSAFAFMGQLGATADREIGRRTGGRI